MVRILSEQTGDGAISISAELEVELKMVVEPGILSRMSPPKRLKLGAVVEPSENVFLSRGTGPSPEQLSEVFQCSLSRTVSAKSTGRSNLFLCNLSSRDVLERWI